jgi:two-component system, response regulator PdtaR
MKTVVIADDEPVTRRDVAGMLDELNFSVVGQACDGFDVVEICRAKHPDVVLLDVKMPVFDGLWAADKIVHEDLAGAVVFLTAFGDREIIEQAKTINVTGYLLKPIDQRALLPVLELVMAQCARYRNCLAESRKAQKKLEESKQIARAQAVISKELNISESEAYQKLRHLSMDKRQSMADLARAILGSGNVR